MTIPVRWRPPMPEHRLVDHGGRRFRIPADCSVTGTLDLDKHHALVVMKRRAYQHRANLWPDAILLQVYRNVGEAWTSRPPSVTVPVDQVGALISALFDAQGRGR
jgi:hypothetical protein